MCTDKNKEKSASSSDFGFEQMDEKMSRMMDMCCMGKGDFPDCREMMKNMMSRMKNQSNQATQESDKKSEDSKK